VKVIDKFFYLFPLDSRQRSIATLWGLFPQFSQTTKISWFNSSQGNIPKPIVGFLLFMEFTRARECLSTYNSI
jgi:hypothetical protein